MFRPLGLIFPLLSLLALAAALCFHLVPSLSPPVAAGLGLATVAIGVAMKFGRRFALNLFALWLFAALALAAFGATPAAAAEQAVTVGPIYGLVEPYIRALADVVITGLIGWGAVLIKSWTGIQIEARHREALHSALMTGVTKALARLGVRAEGLTVDLRSQVLAEAVEWAEAAVPDAIAHFGMTPDRVAALATAKLGQLIAAAPPPPPLVLGGFGLDIGKAQMPPTDPALLGALAGAAVR